MQLKAGELSFNVLKSGSDEPSRKSPVASVWLATTQRYLADVRKPGEAKKAVADADFIPKPNVVTTGTHDD
jgi:hypothetical protein